MVEDARKKTLFDILSVHCIDRDEINHKYNSALFNNESLAIFFKMISNNMVRYIGHENIKLIDIMSMDNGIVFIFNIPEYEPPTVGIPISKAILESDPEDLAKLISLEFSRLEQLRKTIENEKTPHGNQHSMDDYDTFISFDHKNIH